MFGRPDPADPPLAVVAEPVWKAPPTARPPSPPGPLELSDVGLLNADSSDDAPLLVPVLPTAEEPDVPLDVTAGSEKPALVPLVLLALLPRYAISPGISCVYGCLSSWSLTTTVLRSCF